MFAPPSPVGPATPFVERLARAGYRGQYSVSRCIFERHDLRDRVHKLLENVELVFAGL